MNKSVIGYEDRYLISDNGILTSLDLIEEIGNTGYFRKRIGKIIKPGGCKYKSVILCKNKIQNHI